MNINSFSPLFKLDVFSGFTVLAIGVFFGLTLLYSLGFMKSNPRPLGYYFSMVLTAISSAAAVLANNLIILLLFWGLLGFTLYLLINIADGAYLAAKKAFIIVGGSDALMIFGIGIIFYLSGTFRMDQIRLELNSGLAVLAYICVAIACFAKAGVMPFHSWIPDCAEKAPLPVVAFLPASLDKLLGIYLLARISLNLFVMNTGMHIMLMLVGAFTIIAAVMMALIQHNMKRLLGYHAVSQVGYMVLGIGTGNPVGIAGGIFHMLNNTIYKSCLFYTSGNVEQRANTTELDKLGGLARLMPVTYICCLVASLSISGVPPFNGFVSKWMIYQGLIEQFKSVSTALKITACLGLIAAMFGSGLTLASFMKLLHAVFLGQPENQKSREPVKEVSWLMWLPPVLLAILCLVFGIFANQLPLKYFIIPVVGEVVFSGTWYAGLSTVLIIIGLLLGAAIFNAGRMKSAVRQDSSFIGGEPLDLTQNRVSGTEFYNTVRELGILKAVYRKAEAGRFDIYEQAKKIFSFSRILQFLHNGVLPTYLVWMLLGMVGLLVVLVR